MMTAGELQGLTEDVKRFGQREKIVLLDGLVLDGRNRLLACETCKLEPKARDYDVAKDGESPLAFVLGKNLKRRHLTPSQAAAVAVEALPLFEAEAEARKQATKFRKTSPPPAPPTPAPPPPPPEPEQTRSEFLAEVANKIGLPVAFQDGTKVDPTGDTKADAQRIAAHTGSQPALSDEFDQRTPGSEEFGHEEAPEPKPKKQRAPRAKPNGHTPPRPPVEPPPEPPQGKAAEVAAAAVGVSARSVQTAKHLQQNAPDKFEEVKAGTKSLHQAAMEASLESDQVQEAMLKIRQACGQSFHDAVKDQTRLKGAKEIVAFAELEPDKMIQIRGLIESGWSVKEALKYKLQTLCRTHRIDDLIKRAQAGGGHYSLELENFVISVTRKTDALPATAAAEAIKAHKKAAANA